MIVVREGVHVGQDIAQGTLPAVGFGVLFALEPAKEIGGFVVEFVGDEMVTDTDVRFAVLVRVGGAVTVESQCHEDVTFSYTFTKNRISSVHVRANILG